MSHVARVLQQTSQNIVGVSQVGSIVHMYMCILSISQRCRFSAPAIRTPIEAMEHDMLCRIRDALHPFTFCAVPGEVYIRRNEILAELVRHKPWVSSQDKYEVIALIFKYRSHGSHPARNAMRRIVSITAQPDGVETVDQDVDPERLKLCLRFLNNFVPEFPMCLSRHVMTLMMICAILAIRTQSASGHLPSASHVTVSTETRCCRSIRGSSTMHSSVRLLSTCNYFALCCCVAHNCKVLER